MTPTNTRGGEMSDRSAIGEIFEAIWRILDEMMGNWWR